MEKDTVILQLVKKIAVDMTYNMLLNRCSNNITGGGTEL